MVEILFIDTRRLGTVAFGLHRNAKWCYGRMLPNMSYRDLFNEKKRAPHDAVAMIKDSGMKVHVCGEPIALLEALAGQKDRFQNLYLYTMLGIITEEAQSILFAPDTEGHLYCGACYFSRSEVKALKQGRKVEQIISHFSQFEGVIENHVKPEYLLANVSPMDADGYFGLGYCPNGRVAIDAGAKVILQVNECMPAINTDYYKVHISEVTALCEHSSPIAEFFDPVPTEIDKVIADHIIDRIPNGATIQLGIGGLPIAIGNFLKDHKDLGIHTEVFTNTMTKLMKSGVVNNSKKSLYPGVSITAFFQGSKETNDFISNNKNVMCKKLSWVADSAIIAQNNDMISINGCLAVDLRGQVCAESLALNTTGGSGGQLDFVRGARKAPGGKSFIAMQSVVEKPDGSRISKITLTLPSGSIVTTPRNEVQYIATEYGIAEMANHTARERALALISIAHPDFRDQLMFEAKKNNLV